MVYIQNHLELSSLNHVKVEHYVNQPTLIHQEHSSHSMNLQGSLWGHGGGDSNEHLRHFGISE